MAYKMHKVLSRLALIFIKKQILTLGKSMHALYRLDSGLANLQKEVSKVSSIQQKLQEEGLVFEKDLADARKVSGAQGKSVVKLEKTLKNTLSRRGRFTPLLVDAREEIRFAVTKVGKLREKNRESVAAVEIASRSVEELKTDLCNASLMI